MATKNEHADKAQSEEGASGQKGVSQEQVAAAVQKAGVSAEAVARQLGKTP